jgi:hypothetical protein
MPQDHELKFVSSNEWTHNFVGRFEASTRWVFDREKDQLVVAQIQGARAESWLKMSHREAADLLASIHEYSCIEHPDPYINDCTPTAEMPSWALGHEDIEMLAEVSIKQQEPVDKQAQQFIPKALHLEASQISAFLYAGAIECDFDRWDGHVGFVANCAEVALDIAGFLKENAGTENPGVIAYELFEPFGKWMAEEGHLAKNSLLDEFKAQYHAWIKEGQAPIPRESAS